jgi:hypothetical protein
MIMNIYKKLSVATLLGIYAVLMSGCSLIEGTEAWCEAMADKPKSEWTSHEVAEYTKSCLFRSDDD